MHALARCCLSVSCPMRPIDLAARHYPYVTNLVCTQYAPLGGVFFCQTIHTQYAPLGALHARLFTLNTLLLVLVCQTIHTQYALLGIFLLDYSHSIRSSWCFFLPDYSHSIRSSWWCFFLPDYSHSIRSSWCFFLPDYSQALTRS